MTLQATLGVSVPTSRPLSHCLSARKETREAACALIFTAGGTRYRRKVKDGVGEIEAGKSRRVVRQPKKERKEMQQRQRQRESERHSSCARGKESCAIEN